MQQAYVLHDGVTLQRVCGVIQYMNSIFPVFILHETQYFLCLSSMTVLDFTPAHLHKCMYFFLSAS